MPKFVSGFAKEMNKLMYLFGKATIIEKYINKWNIQKYMTNDNTKKISVTPDVHRNLMLLKVKSEFKSLSDVIDFLYNECKVLGKID